MVTDEVQGVSMTAALTRSVPITTVEYLVSVMNDGIPAVLLVTMQKN
jgi:hypothetical protein